MFQENIKNLKKKLMSHSISISILLIVCILLGISLVGPCFRHSRAKKYPYKPPNDFVWFNFGYHPIWSPDGKKITYMGSRGGGIEIKSLDGNYSNDIECKGNGIVVSRDLYPAWSPDGEEIACISSWILPGEKPIPEKESLFIISLDKDFLRKRITPTDFHATSVPCWSPDGKHIAVYGYFGGNIQPGIWVMRTLLGADMTRIAEAKISLTERSDIFGGKLSWSPDGKYIAHRVHNPEDKKWHIAVTPVAGGSTKLLLQTTSDNVFPAWLPDGRIFFCSTTVTRKTQFLMEGHLYTQVQFPRDRDKKPKLVSHALGYTELSTIGRDGENLQKIAKFDNIIVSDFAVSSDGKRIAFGLNSQIYIYNLRTK